MTVVRCLTVQMRVFRYRDTLAVTAGLRELRLRGLTPRGLLFVALDPRGEVYLAIPEDPDAISSVRVGEKFSLVPPWGGRLYHFDAVHRLPGDAVLWNGDLCLADLDAAAGVAVAIADWLKGSSAKNVFLGCAPHVPGSWWTTARAAHVASIHAEGFVDCVVTGSGILARRLESNQLFHLGFSELSKLGAPSHAWHEVFRSELGPILLIERRVVQYRLVLSCEHGLIEIDVSHLPDLVIETARVAMRSGFGVVGRIDGGAFAVTTGLVGVAGLTNLSPAMLVGSHTQSLAELPRILRAQIVW